MGSDWKRVFPKFNLSQNINHRIAQEMEEVVDRKAVFTYLGLSLLMVLVIISKGSVNGKADERSRKTL